MTDLETGFFFGPPPFRPPAPFFTFPPASMAELENSDEANNTEERERERGERVRERGKFRRWNLSVAWKQGFIGVEYEIVKALCSGR